MAEANSFPERSRQSEYLLPRSFLNVEAWQGIPVVTDTGAVVGVVLTASIVEHELSASEAHSSVQTSVGGSHE